MFKMFGTIKNVKKDINKKGIGLGLVICKQIVEKFGGKINFISKYKRGTTFFFSFEAVDFDLDEHMELEEEKRLDEKKKQKEHSSTLDLSKMISLGTIPAGSNFLDQFELL
jgi:signal transduction histidine kinase